MIHVEKTSPEAPPIESLKADLAKAVENEHYEDAAKLRDEISKLTKSN
jgi:protein-arginine kinase activator protein McsA